ncbi:MAG: hypothetical protein QF733_05720 [Phycisphaerales bacterium]|jgi:hypothetical protein|nr:hypothetical protein [Phycisphaerales bacterium]
MTPPTRLVSLSLAVFSLVLVGCGDADSASDPDAHTHAAADAGHDEHPHLPGGDDHGHHHDEVALDPAQIGDMTVELAQSHGSIVAGKEGHLVVKLPYSDGGQTVVRAWIGTEDRTMSFVGLGVYAPSHDDYDIHAMAPDPLPEGALWWIEVAKPGEAAVVGSARPL